MITNPPHSLDSAPRKSSARKQLFIYSLIGFTSLLASPSSSAGTIYYNNLISASNPLLYYGMDETSGTVAADSSGNGRYGIYQTSVVTLGVASAGANLGTAVDNSGASLPTIVTGGTGGDFQNRNFSVGTGDFTFELWFNADNINAGRQDLYLFGNSGFFLSSAGAGSLQYYDGNSLVSNTTVSADTWYLLNVVRSSGTVTMYLNGIALTPTVASSTSINGANGSEANLGGNTGNFAFDGTIDEYAIYGTALSPGVIASHFTAATIPEPGTAALFGVASAFVLLFRRKI